MSGLAVLGELLVDFTPAGEKNGRSLYMQNAGGAPANVAAAVAVLGADVSFLGMVGDDFFGRFVENELRSSGVDTSGLVFSDKYATTLAFVHLSQNGERDFTFIRNPGADAMYDEQNLNIGNIKRAKMFHFGSLMLASEPARSATIKAVETAKEYGIKTSFDPNYRAVLWKSEHLAKEQILHVLCLADIVKLSEDEAEFLFGIMTCEEAAAKVLDIGAKTVFITLGEKGVIYANQTGMGRVPAFKAHAVDTTGAGDCFIGAVLYKMLDMNKSPESLSLKDIAGIAEFACASASISVERPGGMPSMPKLAEVKARLARRCEG